MEIQKATSHLPNTNMSPPVFHFLTVPITASQYFLGRFSPKARVVDYKFLSSGLSHRLVSLCVRKQGKLPCCLSRKSKGARSLARVPWLFLIPSQVPLKRVMQSPGEGLPRFSANQGPSSPFLPFLNLYANLQGDKGLSLQGSFRRDPLLAYC